MRHPRSLVVILTLVAAIASSGCFPTLPPEEDAVDGAGEDTTADVTEDSTSDVGDTGDAILDIATPPDTDTTTSPDADTTTSPDSDTTGPVLNACGGEGELIGDAPGGACGECEDGLVVCDPSDAEKRRTRCVDASARNACGGCGVIDPAVGSDCDECGTITCAEAGTSVTTCVSPAGGCSSNLTCSDLNCAAQGRECDPGLEGEDATCGVCAEGYVEFGEVCLVSLAPPDDVTASTDLEDRVVVSWTAVSGAAGYKVYRCPLTSNCNVATSWTRLTGDAAITETLFADATGGAGGNLVAPANVTASSDDTGLVTVTWDAVEPSAAPVFRYAVTTMSPAGESQRSVPALGSRAVPAVSAYEVSIDGGDFAEVGDALTWNDTTAPAGVVTPGVVAATDGLYADRVEVSVSGVRADAGAERRYAVRAVNARGPGAASAEAIGRRAVGTPIIAWERSAGATAEDFAVVPGVALTAWTDTEAPASGEARWYRVVASADGAEPATSEAVRGARQGPPVPPDAVAATVDRDDGVRITWQAVPGALGYHVYRDGLKLTPGATGITVTQYDDRDDGTLPDDGWAAPAAVTATSNDPFRVSVSWTAPTRPVSEDFVYTVTAVNAAGEGAASDGAAGRRVAPALVGFQVSIDGGAWASAGDAAATVWVDSNAPAPTLTAGTVTASDATDPAKVSLSSTGAGSAPGATRAYAVRVMTASGQAGAASAPVTGRREAGALQRQWQRSSGASADGFSNLSGATGMTHEDTTAPSNGEVRYYRLEVSANGAETVFTEADPGSRLPPAGVPGNVQATTDRTDGIRVTWGGVSGATGYHVYRGATRLTPSEGTTGTSFDDTTSATALSSSWQAPTGLAATNGPDSVALAWTAPTRPTSADLTYTVTALNLAGESAASAPATGRRVGAALTGFEVSIDNGAWVDLGGTATAWTDTGAQAGSVGVTSVAASDEAYAEFVRLTSAVSRSDGTQRSYRVRAKPADNTTTAASTAANGRRVVGQPELQWERASAAAGPFTGLSGATTATFDDTTAPSEGTRRYYRLRVTATGAAEVVSAVVDGARLPAPEAPDNVVATVDRTDGIVITWDGVDRASGYHVFRGATRLTDFPTTETSYTDTSTATEPPAWDGISGLTATGSLSGVTLSWTLPTRPGRTQAYTVRSVNAAGQSGLSAEAVGTRLAPGLTAVEVGVRRSATSAETVTALAADAATWLDGDAALATPAYDDVSASLSLYADAVALAVENPTILPAPTHDYRVRLVTDTALPWSGTVTQRRTAPETMTIQWQRDDGDGFLDLDGVTGAEAADMTAAEDGTRYDYRARFVATGMEDMPTLGQKGSRLAFVQVVAGARHSCALDAAGKVWCWGANDFGQLGLGYASSDAVNLPTEASVVGGGFEALFGGPLANSTCGITNAGDTQCWGEIASLWQATEVELNLPQTPVTIALGGGLFLCLQYQSPGGIWCLGNQAVGELGDNRGNVDSLAPVQVVYYDTFARNFIPLAGASELAVGRDHGCAKTGAGTRCWGNNDAGQLGSQVSGDDTWAANLVMQNQNTPLAGVVSVSTGSRHSCAILDTQTFSGAVCWGRNLDGELGDGTVTSRVYANAPVIGLNGYSPDALHSGEAFNCISTPDDPTHRYCWGANGRGQLMRGFPSDSETTADQTIQVGDTESLVTGANHGCYVNSNLLNCWGTNKNGSLGIGSDSPTSSSEPVNVALPLLLSQ